MKQLLITIVTVLLVGCFTQPIEPVAEVAAQQPTAKASNISIHDAAREGNIEAVKQHLATGTDVNARNGGGSTPLLGAARKGHKEIAELLIANGADVNAKVEYAIGVESIEGWTPLHVAAAEGHKEIADLLITKGAGVNAMDDTRRSPLDWAQKVEVWHSPKIKVGKKETADLILKNGGKPGYEL